MGSGFRAQALAPATTKLEPWLDRLSVLENFTSVKRESHPTPSCCCGHPTQPPSAPPAQGLAPKQSSVNSCHAHCCSAGNGSLDLAAHYLLGLAPLLMCCTVLGKSLNILSINMGLMAPVPLQGSCENHKGWWLWKNLNGKVHPLLMDYDYCWL